MIVLDPIGYCLLRELVEADEAHSANYATQDIIIYTSPHFSMGGAMKHAEEYRVRANDYMRFKEAFLDHIVLMPPDGIDIHEYVRLISVELIPDRHEAQIWEAGKRIAQIAVNLYRTGQIMPLEGP